MKTVILALFALVASSEPAGRSAGPLRLSEAGYRFIISEETGGEAYYKKRLSHPTWPGGASGVTIGIGYDLGYNTVDQIKSDWGSLPADHLRALVACAGIRGEVAKVKARSVSWVTISWEQAEAVFQRSTMGRFGSLTNKTFPTTSTAKPDTQAALLSIVFNRGGSLSGASRREMLEISKLTRTGQWGKIPTQIRSMKRLWYGKGLNGLLIRREREATMIEKEYP